MQKLIETDASGGGQMLRDAIAYSALTGMPAKIRNIRRNKPRPGIKKQHLASLKLLKVMTGAKVSGANVGSTQVFFSPKKYLGGKYDTNIGSAGSITLLLQSILLPSLKDNTKIRIIGGTDVPFSPPCQYMKDVLLPMASKARANYSLEIISRGYYPAGGGTTNFQSKKAGGKLRAIAITERGDLEKITIYSHCSSLAKKVALNQASSARKIIEEKICDVLIEEKISCAEESEATGSGIDIIADFGKTKLGANALGMKNSDAVATGRHAAQRLIEEINSGTPMDKHLLDQLIPFAAAADGKSEFVCSEITSHAKSAMKTAQLFLGTSFNIEPAGKLFRVKINGAGVQFND